MRFFNFIITTVQLANEAETRQRELMDAIWIEHERYEVMKRKHDRVMDVANTALAKARKP